MHLPLTDFEYSWLTATASDGNGFLRIALNTVGLNIVLAFRQVGFVAIAVAEDCNVLHCREQILLKWYLREKCHGGLGSYKSG